MDSSSLTTEQAQRIVATIRPALGYVYRLACRMQRVGWKPSDPMYIAAWAAYDALHTLHVRAHYTAVTPGTGGRPSEPTPPGATPSPAAPPFTTHPAAEAAPRQPRKNEQPWVGKRRRPRR